MKKKKIILAFFTLFFVCVSYLSCRKTSLDENQSSKIDSKSIAMVKTWLTNEKTVLNDSHKIIIDSVLTLVKWDQGYIIKITEFQSLFYIPLNSSSNNIALNVFFNENNKNIDSANLVVTKLATDNNQAIALATVNANIYKQLQSIPLKYMNFSGRILSYSITNKFKYEYGIKHDKIYYSKFILPKPKENGMIGSRNQIQAILCDHYYWVTQNWETGIEHWEYLWSNCYDDGGCPTTTGLILANGNQIRKSDCGGGNNNGGTPGPPPEPGFESCVTSPNDASELMSNVQIETISEIKGYNGTNNILATGEIERPAIRTVQFCRATFPYPFANVVEYGTNYIGVQYKTNANDPDWKWRNISYSDYAQLSGVMPTCWGITLNVTATSPTISGDRKSAYAPVKYSGQYKLICAFGWQVASISGYTLGKLEASQQFE